MSVTPICIPVSTSYSHFYFHRFSGINSRVRDIFDPSRREPIWSSQLSLHLSSPMFFTPVLTHIPILCVSSQASTAACAISSTPPAASQFGQATPASPEWPTASRTTLKRLATRCVSLLSNWYALSSLLGCAPSFPSLLQSLLHYKKT